MSLLKFRRATPTHRGPAIPALLDDASIEVMPRTAAKIADFRDHLPPGTRVFVAHIAGTPIEDMVATASRLRAEGFRPVPHIPARVVPNRAALADWIARYQGEAGVTDALLLAGGVAEPEGDFHSSMQLLETGLFDRAGFRRLHIAGHPEGNRDIDPDGSDHHVAEALRWKQAFAERTGADVAIVTQFAFEPRPIIDWAEALRANGIRLPVHIGIAGPAKLQTLIKYAIACGVGPSLRVLQRRAMDVSQLLLPYEPTDVVAALAEHKAANPDFAIERVHVFPLGGIAAGAGWLTGHRGAQPAQAWG